MLAQEVIRHKRDGKKLTEEEINFFIQGVADWSVSECQIASFVMSIFLNGMDNDEAVLMTKAMASCGQKMTWADKNLSGPVVDKHSTGGVGDKVSVVLAPILAACGAFVPMISGLGLGHTGGTAEKFSAIPGYSIRPDVDLFYKVTQEVGCAVIGQTGDLAPADKRIYSVRDQTSTIESVPLITTSVLSKKLAAGADALVIDLKCGNGAFMRSIEDAQAQAHQIVDVATRAGIPARALITDMNQVMGSTVGNTLEIAEAVDYLKGVTRDTRLHAVTAALCSEALVLTGLAADRNEAQTKVQTALDSGKAAETFARMVTALGGPADFIDDPWKHLAKAPVVRPVLAKQDGYVSAVDTRQIGNAALIAGGVRDGLRQRPDSSVGFSDFITVGQKISAGDPIAVIHALNEESFAQAEKMVHTYVQVNDGKPKETPVVYETITA